LIKYKASNILNISEYQMY